MSYKPETYPSVSPYLVVDDPKALFDFLAKVFDGKVVRQHDRPDGSLMHAEVQIDDSVVMIGQPVGDFKSNPSMIHIYVPDAMAVYHKAMEAGAVSQQEPKRSADDPKDSDLRGGFQGPCGNSWWVGTQQPH